MNIDPASINILKLVLRSPDIGDGWRSVSKTVWPLIQQIKAKGLFELNETDRLIRLSSDGNTVARYL